MIIYWRDLDSAIIYAFGKLGKETKGPGAGFHVGSAGYRDTFRVGVKNQVDDVWKGDFEVIILLLI